MTITTVFDPPLPTDSTSTFNTKAFGVVEDLNTWSTEANALATTVSADKATVAADKATVAADKATVAADKATVAADKATVAADKATTLGYRDDAAISAAAAASAAMGFVGTSTTSMLIGTGSKTFTTQANEQYTAGIWVKVSSQANPANYMYGVVTSYATTSIVVDVQVVGGSGTYADWNISLAGERGPAGTGIVEQTTGFTATGGTTPKTLTVDVDLTASAVASITGTETLTNKTIEAGTFTNGYTEETVSANTGTAYTIDLANGTVQILTLTGNCTYTFPANTAGKSFLLVQKQDATGSRTVTWDVDVKWPASTAPTITGTASKADVFAFTCDGTYWYGRVIGQNYL